MAVHSQWLPLNVWPVLSLETSVRLLRNRPKTPSRMIQRQHKEAHMQDRENNPAGLKPLAFSQQPASQAKKETRPIRSNARQNLGQLRERSGTELSVS